MGSLKAEQQLLGRGRREECLTSKDADDSPSLQIPWSRAKPMPPMSQASLVKDTTCHLVVQRGQIPNMVGFRPYTHQSVSSCTGLNGLQVLGPICMQCIVIVLRVQFTQLII